MRDSDFKEVFDAPHEMGGEEWDTFHVQGDKVAIYDVNLPRHQAQKKQRGTVTHNMR